MKKLWTLFWFGMAIQPLYAVTIPAGTFFFDNSRTGYSHVKFVYGYDSRPESYVVSMSLLASDTCSHSAQQTWQVTFTQALSSIYRYTFAETDLADGMYSQRFSDLKEAISKTYNERRTATREDSFTAGQIFIPSSSDNWAQGTWTDLCRPAPPSSAPSGTLPVLYIETQNHAPITSKETYLPGVYWLDPMGVEDVDSIGSSQAPLPLEIRGRGNYTWRDFDKKPYRIKLDSKQSLAGLQKSKHFALLAHADDRQGFMKNPLGFWFSEHIGLKWTPDHRPIEVVLNGQYWGLYFLTETIRVDKDRVAIVEQEDGCTHPDSITGGWLVEIDNYYSATGQVHLRENNGQDVWLTLHTPEQTSAEQWYYIETALSRLNEALYAPTAKDWLQIVDLAEAAKFYIVQEIVEDCESYHGSCYLYKEMGTDAKWFFGPVWDFGNALGRHQERFIWDQPTWSQCWIGQLYTYPEFQQEVKKQWRHFLYYEYPKLDSFITAYTDAISRAAQNDAAKWPNYGNANMAQKRNDVLNYIHWRVNWLTKQWGQGAPDDTADKVPTYTDAAQRIMTNGHLYLRCKGQVYDILGRIYY